uniref:Uncharacterized protein n=1 Tax=Arundo donax TaxID=35708 RepID=A0A0A9DB84_ARUDO
MKDGSTMGCLHSIGSDLIPESYQSCSRMCQCRAGKKLQQWIRIKAGLPQVCVSWLCLFVLWRVECLDRESKGPSLVLMRCNLPRTNDLGR